MLKPNCRRAAKSERHMDCTSMQENVCRTVLVKGRGRRTYAEEQSGAADRVQVHLTHGLVVEQGHPEERHTRLE